ncbi:MAG: BrnT family toxin [Pseudomonadota bacterium]
MQFEWDEAKNRWNVEKHGISFETASRMFFGPVLTALDARFEYGEERFISVGKVDGVLIIVAVHTDRDG